MEIKENTVEMFLKSIAKYLKTPTKEVWPHAVKYIGALHIKDVLLTFVWFLIIGVLTIIGNMWAFPIEDTSTKYHTDMSCHFLWIGVVISWLATLISFGVFIGRLVDLIIFLNNKHADTVRWAKNYLSNNE